MAANCHPNDGPQQKLHMSRGIAPDYVSVNGTYSQTPGQLPSGFKPPFIAFGWSPQIPGSGAFLQ